MEEQPHALWKDLLMIRLVLAAGAAYVLGAKAGRGRYEQIRKTASAVASSPATKKAKNKGTSGNAKPNSSGELCWKYHQTGECTFKGKCIHKHVPPGDDTDGDDDRE